MLDSVAGQQDQGSQHAHFAKHDPSSLSWWSWRPGIKPRNALLIGGPITFIALLFLGIGLITLVLGIIDAYSPPILLPGTVLSHNVGSINGQPHLTIRLHTTQAGFPDEVSLAVPANVSHSIHDGDPLFVAYSPHLHFPYALDSAGQHYALPGVSAAGNPFGSIALLLLGLIALPYPALLLFWGWCDLQAGRGIQKSRRGKSIQARVVNLRNTAQARTARPGLTPRPSSAWYGIAVSPSDSASSAFPHSQQFMTFSISQQMFTSVHEGAFVDINYSSHLHYVYTLKSEEPREPASE